MDGGIFETYGEDYLDSYAPVVSFSSVRMFLYLALCIQMCIMQIDVMNVFLNGALSESVWLMSPRGIPGVN